MNRVLILILEGLIGIFPLLAAPAKGVQVDFRYAPPQWQTAICFPDDPFKTLVDEKGTLLYHYRRGGREFGTQISVFIPHARWIRQELFDPKIPIVRTFYQAGDLQIVEEAFAYPIPKQLLTSPVLERVDQGEVLQNWANPQNTDLESIRHVALHKHGSLRYQIHVRPGGRRRIALAFCEGRWIQPGKRIEIVRVEGAHPVRVDPVADFGPNQAGLVWLDGEDQNHDGLIRIQIDPAPEAPDPTPILNGMWVFRAGSPKGNLEFLAKRLAYTAEAIFNPARPLGPARNDLILVTVRNVGDRPQSFQPYLVVNTRLPFAFFPDRQEAIVEQFERVTASLRMTGRIRTQGSRHEIELEKIRLAPGQTRRFFVLWSGGGQIVVTPKTLQEALEGRARAIHFWQNCNLPYDRVQIPDPRIQALFDSSIRNIWQAREIKHGLPAFQVGPTCYRGLWIADGAFILEAVTLLGQGQEARNGVLYELRHQKPDGCIEVMKHYWKENGLVLWTCVRHARLTQDKAWLRSIWPRLERIAQCIHRLREATYHNVTPLDDGLMPPGFPDGGIGGVIPEYTNPYWNLAGLRAFIDGARWLGLTNEVRRWQQEFRDFMTAFRKAAARDMRTDAAGHRYLPIRMDGKDLPQRGQWAFCHAVYPGQIFPKNDPLVLDNMAMLESTEREGMVYGTGWDPHGIWNYFASFYGHAWLWLGRGRKAAEVLYAFANHAAPTLVWREEQALKGHRFRKVGDMPHNWASAEFIRLTVHLLELDRGRELHLFEGLPQEWIQPGKTLRLNGIATPFGPLRLTLQVSSDGQSAFLSLDPLSDPSCQKIVVHLGGWASSDPHRTMELRPDRPYHLKISLDHRPIPCGNGKRTLSQREKAP